MGWLQPSAKLLNLKIVNEPAQITDLVRSSPSGTIHICQGIRANKLVNTAQNELSRLGIPYWAIIETIEEQAILAPLKRLLYFLLLRKKAPSLQGILAIGWRTKAWLVNRGFPAHSIYSFAYFLSDDISSTLPQAQSHKQYNFIFVGQLIERKRIDILIKSLSLLNTNNFKLTVIGNGILRPSLERYARKVIPGKVTWLGNVQMHKIPAYISNADCLVLPSRHDGWGAVVSEALMVGTPVICSNACGSAEVVRASGYGGVFPANNTHKLSLLLESMISAGPIDTNERDCLRSWSKSLGAREGAKYLMSVLFPTHPKSCFPPPRHFRSC